MHQSWKSVCSVAALAVFAVVMAGCRTEATTRIYVAHDGQVEVVAELLLTGPVVDVLEGDDALLAELEDMLGARFSQLEVIESASRYRARLSASDLSANTDVTGVRAVSVDTGEDEATIRVDLVIPEGLRSAIASSVAGLPDGPELAATTEANTVIRIEVAFPGEVTASTGFSAEGRTAIFETALTDMAGEQILVATGGTRESGSRLPWLVVAAVVAGAGIFWKRRE
jgi:hypothetical protein